MKEYLPKCKKDKLMITRKKKVLYYALIAPEIFSRLLKTNLTTSCNNPKIKQISYLFTFVACNIVELKNLTGRTLQTIIFCLICNPGIVKNRIEFIGCSFECVTSHAFADLITVNKICKIILTGCGNISNDFVFPPSVSFGINLGRGPKKNILMKEIHWDMLANSKFPFIVESNILTSSNEFRRFIAFWLVKNIQPMIVYKSSKLTFNQIYDVINCLDGFICTVDDNIDENGNYRCNHCVFISIKCAKTGREIRITCKRK